MIYVTGDMHGDLSRFKSGEIKRIKRGDYLVVCGDFGFLWEGGKREEKQLNWIAHRRFTTLFLDGVHENRELLNAYSQTEMFGGVVRRLGKRLYHLKRGYVFEIEGKRIFVMGGGESENSDDRSELDTYWPEEMPSREEIEAAALRLEEVDYTVDYIMTYEAATTIKNAMDIRRNTLNPLNAFLDRVLRSCAYTKWFFGCYHLDRKISGTHYALFKDVLPVEELPEKKRSKRHENER